MKQENVVSLEYWYRMFGLNPKKFTLTNNGIKEVRVDGNIISSKGTVGMRTRVAQGRFKTRRDPNFSKGHGSVHGEGTGRRESES